jgi:serine/threonine protein kinase
MSPRLGDVLANKYRLETLLGRGGMGSVFAAFHIELGHRVAIKVLRSDDPSASIRFLREAQTCASLNSDHVVRVFDIGRLPGGAPYIVMERLVGEDLAHVIARGHVAASDAAEYVLQACAALTEAHAAGVVHRDLKPANLFLTTRREAPSVVKVLDFGISKLTPQKEPEGALALTSTGTILGSPLYMSPEQIRGYKDVDARTDIWSLGVVLYELVTGQPPFRAQTLSALSVAIATEAPKPPSSIRTDLPPGFEGVVLRCLEKDRTSRFDSADALRQAIAPFVVRSQPEYVVETTSLTPSARNHSPPVPTASRRSGRVAASIFGALLLLVGSSAFLQLARRGGTRASAEPPVTLPTGPSLAAILPPSSSSPSTSVTTLVPASTPAQIQTISPGGPQTPRVSTRPFLRRPNPSGPDQRPAASALDDPNSMGWSPAAPPSSSTSNTSGSTRSHPELPAPILDSIDTIGTPPAPRAR